MPAPYLTTSQDVRLMRGHGSSQLVTCHEICVIVASMNEKSESPSKRGRKPIGDAPMTAAERKRATRARKSAEGRVEFTVGLGGGMLAFIDRMVLASGSSRSQVLFDLLEMAISRIALLEVQAEDMWAKGATDEEVQAFMAESLRSTPPPHLVQKYKEVMDIQ